MEEYRYIKGSKTTGELIELINDKQPVCFINVQLLLSGVKTFVGKENEDVSLSEEQRLAALKALKDGRRRITDSYAIKTLDGWHESGLPNFEDFCFPGDVVDSALVSELINCVPPLLMRFSCTQAGEPFSQVKTKSGIYKDTYPTFHKVGQNKWIFDGYCFYEENENRVVWKSRADQILERIEKYGRW